MISKLDTIFSKYHKVTNMSYSELLRWSNNPCSREASLDRKPIRRNLRLLSKSKSKWTAKDITDANRTIAFVSRMKKVKGGEKVNDCGLSKRDISLLNWAYDVRKKR